MKAYSTQISATTFASFGMVMDNRNYCATNTGKYRYGMNTQEKDNEIFEGAYTAEYWEYDSRIGRRWNLDPKPQIGMSDYSCFGNNPIIYFDILGDAKESKHLDPDGKLIVEYKDGDKNVYQHQTAKTKSQVDFWRKKSGKTSGWGVNVTKKVGGYNAIGSLEGWHHGNFTWKEANSNNSLAKTNPVSQTNTKSGGQSASQNSKSDDSRSDWKEPLELFKIDAELTEEFSYGSVRLTKSGSLSPKFYASGWMKGNQYVKTLYSLPNTAKVITTSSEIVLTGMAAYKIGMGVGTPITHVDLDVGVLGLGAKASSYFSGVEVPYVGEAVAIYGIFRLSWDLGAEHGISTWFNDDSPRPSMLNSSYIKK